MATKKSEQTEQETPTQSASQELVAALVQAINATKPVEKKNPVNRKVNTPWTPKDGSPKLKLKRQMYQHSILLDPDMLTNRQIELLNKVKPGTFLDGYVTIRRRRDKGIDIDYKIKTAAQRLRLVNQFGIRDFDELLERCIDEAANPKKFADPEDE